ncbi:MAG: NAD(P)/FAD-dependent oxidoreductase, partial [Mangrovicoccus sp.]
PDVPVVLIGAGFIGCIILEALAKMGVNLTVVEMGDRMVPRMLDETAGNMLRSWCETKGVQVITNALVQSIEDAGGAPASDSKPGFFARLFGKAKSEPTPVVDTSGASKIVRLKDGTTLPAALVVVAAGVKSNIEFLEGSGIETKTGIMVNPHLETSVADVYAAGDVCEGINLSTGLNDMLAIQPVAVEHGYIAAQNMTGHTVTHRGSLNMNVLDTLGLISSSFGTWEGVDGGESVKLVDHDAHRYIRLEFDGEVLVGAQCVGVTDHIGMMRGLIQTGLPLGSWKQKLMDSPARLPEAYVATMQKAPSYGPAGPKVAVPA